MNTKTRSVSETILSHQGLIYTLLYQIGPNKSVCGQQRPWSDFACLYVGGFELGICLSLYIPHLSLFWVPREGSAS